MLWAAFRNTDAAQPDFGPACFGAAVCLYILIHLPAGTLSCVAQRVTNQSGIEKHGSPGHA